ncbi:MAG: hypothetical protein K2I28_00230 [Muribaculaceae bacterium]|nr:hypothetical protein [Muribaculaceae bacterium]
MTYPSTISADDLRAATRPTNSRHSQRAKLSDDRIKELKRRFIDVARSVCPEFTVYPETRAAINDIFHWCLKLDGPLDPERGLWLWGNIGTGKSTMLAIIREFCHQYRGHSHEMSRFYPRGDKLGSPYWFAINNTSDICSDFATNGYSALNKYVLNGRLALDDLGAEPRLTGNYSSLINVIQEILHRRYDYRRLNFTHVTTNLSPDQIAEAYGERVADRCLEMFNFIHYGEYTNRQNPTINH